MIRTAISLARKGLAVFPCRPRDKRPATNDGVKSATTDTSTIREWWGLLPDANVAIATGASSGVFVVDIDGPDAEAELRRLEVQYGTPLPGTIEAITARGRHCYLRMPEIPVRCSASKVAPGIDVRGDGGYVLAPPSIHPSGKLYCWSVDSANEFADAPDWLLERVIASNGNSNGATPPKEWRALVEAGVAEGARDNTITRLAGHLLRHRVDPFVVLGLLQAWNAERCAPPLPAEDIERIVDSICRREVGRQQVEPQWPPRTTS